MHIHKKNKRGFTLIEVLVVIGIIAILASIVLVAVNPSRQFKLARDSQRVSNVNAILNAIQQNMSEHRGIFVCGGAPHTLPSDDTPIKYSAVAGDPGHIAGCIVPTYLSALPYDPFTDGANFNSENEYDTKYSYSADANGRVTVRAIGEITPAISVTR